MIQLQDIEFSPCSVIWDEGGDKFRKATKDEIYLCCDRKCDKYRGECDRFCDENYRRAYKGTLQDCLFSCGVMGNVCDKMCESARFTWGRQYFDGCLAQEGCMRNEYLDNQCLIDKKDRLLACCMKNCRPRPDLNCEQHCGISYNINLERSAPKIQQSASGARPPRNSRSRLWLHLTVLAAFLLAIFFIAFKLKWSNMKI